ncbi:hypothetical protein ABTZ58_10030 [Streptomyces sp. NPDC094143]|uniref:hypothetical protein n=1 Tax=Streptomyces sp. NPDC094143 TaxID=3155310 RepID=UPI00332FDD7D
MPKFKIKTDAVEVRTDAKKTVTGTVAAQNERGARGEVYRDLAKHGYRVDGHVEVERDNS